MLLDSNEQSGDFHREAEIGKEFCHRVRYPCSQQTTVGGILYPLSKALDMAIDRCIADNVLRDFLREHGGEVKRVMTLDYTFERRLKLAKEENLEIIEQLTGENKQLSGEKNQLLSENEYLLSEVERMKSMLADHGIEF